MANVLVNEQALSSIADAIREKNGSEDTYKPGQMAEAISAIESGGGITEKIHITGNFDYGLRPTIIQQLFKENKIASDGNIVTSIDHLGHQKTSPTEVDDTDYSKLTLTLQLPSGVSWQSATSLFQNWAGTTLPNIIIIPHTTNTSSASYTMDNMFYGAQFLKTIPDNWFNLIDDATLSPLNLGNSVSMFQNCHSLLEVPMEGIKHLLSHIKNLHTTSIAYYSSIYNSFCYKCYSLNKIEGLPVINRNSATTSSMFSMIVSQCVRLRKFTFETQEDGTPYTVKWRSQLLDLTAPGSYLTSIIPYIPDPDKTSQATNGMTAQQKFELYGDDPDFTPMTVYASWFNHDAAVETINSLPDASDYLASLSTAYTNTIKFTASCGRWTPAGSISNLTDEEIAVATDKGWTVTIT